MKSFSPNLVIIILVILLIIAAAYFYIDKTRNQNAATTSVDPKTLASSSENSGLGVSPAAEYYNEATISGTPIPSQAPLTVYVYPGADITSQTSVSLALQSTDDPQVITDWYKDKRTL